MAAKGVLSHEESLKLIDAAQNGDEQAKETLIVRNTALVKSIVKKFLNRGVEFEDLLQIGSLGLVKAVLGYDAKFNVRFSTYAVPMIAGEIKRFLRDDGIIKVSRSLRERSFEIFGAKETLKEELKREPTIDEISAHILASHGKISCLRWRPSEIQCLCMNRPTMMITQKRCLSIRCRKTAIMN